MTVAPTTQADFVPIPRPTATLVPVEEDATILVDQANGNCQVLNATGALMWQCFDGQSTVGEIAADVADVFGIDLDEAIGGLTAMVDSLQTASMLAARDEGEIVPVAEPALGRTKYLDVRPSS